MSELQKALLESIERHAKHGKSNVGIVNLGVANLFTAILDDVQRIQDLNKLQ